MATLSVVLASYNGARFIGEQLDSIASQTRRPDELIVTDDGSTDDTVAIVEDRLRSLRGISVQVLQGPGLGYAENFWHGLGASGGDLVAWSDQDDVWLSGKLARQERALESSGAHLVTHSATVVNDVLVPSGRVHQAVRRTTALPPLDGDPWFVASGFASMFRRRLVAGVSIEDRPDSHQLLRPMGHDHVVSLAAFASARRMRLADQLALYRQHDTNTAGIWSKEGAEAVAFSLTVGAQEYRELSRITDSWADWVATLPRAIPDAEAYFRRCAARARCRSLVYVAGNPVTQARRMMSAAAAGTYHGRRHGGFGARGAARDLAQTVLPGRFT